MKDTFSTIVGILSIMGLLIMALTYTGLLDERAKDLVMPIIGIIIFHEGYIRYGKHKLLAIFLMVFSVLGILILAGRYFGIIG